MQKIPFAAVDDCLAGDYPENLYQSNGTVSYLQNLDDFDETQYSFFQENGYLCFRQAFSPNEIQDALDGLTFLLKGGVPEFDAIQYEQQGANLKDSDAVRKIMWFVEYEQRLQAIAYHPKLMALVETIIGEEVQLIQDMALLKPPKIGREKPWHQDKAFFNYPFNAKIVGVWIALDQTDEQNGCMHIMPTSHKEGPVIHFHRRDWQICDTDMLGKSCKSAPMESGGMLVFDSLLQHGTPANYSGKRRRALQFHYAPKSVSLVPVEIRLENFGSEGRDVTC